MSNEDMASRIQVYLKKIEKIRVKRMKREKFEHLLKTLGLSAGTVSYTHLTLPTTSRV